MLIMAIYDCRRCGPDTAVPRHARSSDAFADDAGAIGLIMSIQVRGSSYAACL
jgi:hypothetical protein